MVLSLALRFAVVLLFLAVFLRRPKLLSGLGLLTVTSAVLLDTFLGTFGREETIDELGFFFYIITGILFGGAAIWLWGTLRPLLNRSSEATAQAPLGGHTVVASEPVVELTQFSEATETADATFDRQDLYEQIRFRLGPEDVLDLVFDLGINENDIFTIGQDMNGLIINLMDAAIENGQSGALALAVERILTPMPAEHLPRLEHISEESPPTVLRHYLLAHYDLASLQAAADELAVDWEQLSIGSKKSLVRSLLLYLYRRNRIEDLIELLQEELHQEPE